MFEADQQIVDELASDDPVFRQLYDTHHELKKRIRYAEEGVHPVEDLVLVEMKKQRLHAKDEMAHMIETYRREQMQAA